MSTEQTQSWLWPDRAIGVRESGELRKEHNRLVNSHAQLLAACEQLVSQLRLVASDDHERAAVQDGEAAIAAATSETSTAKGK